MLWDFKCPACGRVVEMNVKTPNAEVICFNCDGIMERQLSAPSFNVQGYSYKNGYAKDRK